MQLTRRLEAGSLRRQKSEREIKMVEKKFLASKLLRLIKYTTSFGYFLYI